MPKSSLGLVAKPVIITSAFGGEGLIWRDAIQAASTSDAIDVKATVDSSRHEMCAELGAFDMQVRIHF